MKKRRVIRPHDVIHVCSALNGERDDTLAASGFSRLLARRFRDSLRPDVTAAGRTRDSGCAGAGYFPRFAVALRVAGFRRETAGGVGGAAFVGSRGTVQEKRCFPA